MDSASPTLALLSGELFGRPSADCGEPQASLPVDGPASNLLTSVFIPRINLPASSTPNNSIALQPRKNCRKLFCQPLPGVAFGSTAVTSALPRGAGNAPVTGQHGRISFVVPAFGRFFTGSLCSRTCHYLTKRKHSLRVTITTKCQHIKQDGFPCGWRQHPSRYGDLSYHHTPGPST